MEKGKVLVAGRHEVGPHMALGMSGEVKGYVSLSKYLGSRFSKDGRPRKVIEFTVRGD